MGALGVSWGVLGELWGPTWASLAALETIENHWFSLYFQLWGHISSQRHLRGQASDALIPCPSKYLVRFGPKSLVCPRHLSNLAQTKCLSKSLVQFRSSHLSAQFGPSHLSAQGICPIWAKSLSPKLPKDTPVAGNATKTNGFSMVSEAARDAQIEPKDPHSDLQGPFRSAQ